MCAIGTPDAHEHEGHSAGEDNEAKEDAVNYEKRLLSRPDKSLK